MQISTQRGGSICDFDRTVTPMVDVVFQLLIFFVLASGGRMAERTVSTVLSAGALASPETRHPEKQTDEIWIHVRRDSGRRETLLRLAGREYRDISLLAAPLRKLAENPAESVVILDVAADVPLGDVIGVYDACRSAKLGSINFAATPDEMRPHNKLDARTLHEGRMSE